MDNKAFSAPLMDHLFVVRPIPLPQPRVVPAPMGSPSSGLTCSLTNPQPPVLTAAFLRLASPFHGLSSWPNLTYSSGLPSMAGGQQFTWPPQPSGSPASSTTHTVPAQKAGGGRPRPCTPRTASCHVRPLNRAKDEWTGTDSEET